MGISRQESNWAQHEVTVNLLYSALIISFLTLRNIITVTIPTVNIKCYQRVSKYTTLFDAIIQSSF